MADPLGSHKNLGRCVMSLVDWGLIQIQYETLGSTVEQLSEQFDISEAMIRYAIEEKSWKQMPICAAVQDWRNVEQVQDIGEELITEVQDRMRIMQTVKQSTLGPKYIALETAILGKGLEVIRGIHPDNPNAANQLKAITDVLQSLAGGKSSGGVNGGNSEAKPSLTVKVMSQVGPECGEAKVAAQVEIANEVG